MKKIFTILLLAITLGAVAQKAKLAPVYTFAGKSSEISMTWDEYSKSKKELTPVDNGVTIKSFTVSILVTNGAGSVYIDHANSGAAFTTQTVSEIEKMHNNPNFGGTLFFSSVIIIKDNKEQKAPETTIKIK